MRSCSSQEITIKLFVRSFSLSLSKCQSSLFTYLRLFIKSFSVLHSLVLLFINTSKCVVNLIIVLSVCSNIFPYFSGSFFANLFANSNNLFCFNNSFFSCVIFIS